MPAMWRCAQSTLRVGRERGSLLLDAQFLQLVAQGAEGDAQLGGGAGLVVAVVGQGLLDGLALDLLDEVRQRTGGGLARVDAGRIERGKSCR